jgi:hypothetical protein
VGHTLCERLHPLVHEERDEPHQGEYECKAHAQLMQAEPGILAQQLTALKIKIDKQRVIALRESSMALITSCPVYFYLFVFLA